MITPQLSHPFWNPVYGSTAVHSNHQIKRIMKLRINFNLKTGVASEEVPVLAILNYGYKEYDVNKKQNVYKPLKYYTGVKVKKTEWDQQQKLPVKKALQSELLQMEKQINDVFHALRVNGEVNPVNLKNALDAKIKGKEIETVKRIRIVDFIQTEILSDPTMKRGTREGYNMLRKQLERLETRLGKPVFTHEFNEGVYKVFMEDVRARNNRLNSVYNTYKNLRAILRRIAFKYKIQVFNLTLDLPMNQKVKGSVNEKIYLSFGQLQKVIDYQPETVRMRNVKLIFLTLCLSGTRYSDVFKVIPEHHYSDDDVAFSYARFSTKKNNKEVIIPILKPLADAFAANGGPAYRIHETQFNKDLKVLMRESGLVDEQILSYTDAYGQIQFEKKEFCDFVTSHTGRRSFITNLIRKVPIPMLAKITTHETMNTPDSGEQLAENSVIMRYDQISLISNAVEFVHHLKRLQTTDTRYFVLKLV